MSPQPGSPQVSPPARPVEGLLVSVLLAQVLHSLVVLATLLCFLLVLGP